MILENLLIAEEKWKSSKMTEVISKGLKTQCEKASSDRSNNLNIDKDNKCNEGKYIKSCLNAPFS